MNGPDFHHRFSKEILQQLLTQAAGRPTEVAERLQWFLYFCNSGSVGATCKMFGIARTTFYRWAHRFNPYDLHSLEDAPNLLTQERINREPAPSLPPVVPSPVPPTMPNSAMRLSLLLNAVFAISILLSLLWQMSPTLRASLTRLDRLERTSECQTQTTSALLTPSPRP